ncbi:MAG TPA: hypothetical protein DCP54_03510, partial [Chryseobacterium sp.]|nr:hypothetical protein [Chryseobacterium sp.]
RLVKIKKLKSRTIFWIFIDDYLFWEIDLITKKVLPVTNFLKIHLETKLNTEFSYISIRSCFVI